MNPMNGNTVCRSCFRSYVTVPQPSRLRTQGQRQECQQQHPQQPHCQDQGVNHQAQQVNQNINITSVNSAGSKFLFFHSLFRRLQRMAGGGQTPGLSLHCIWQKVIMPT